MLATYQRQGYGAYLRWRLRQPCPMHTTALLLARLDLTDDAIAELGKAYDEHGWALVYLNADPEWDTLRPDPRFQILTRSMNFPSFYPATPD